MSSNTIRSVGIFVTLLFLISPLYAQAPAKTEAQKSMPVAPGKTIKVEGSIVKRDGDALTVRDAGGSNIAVILTGKTEVREKKSNLFRRSKSYSAAQLVRGLSVEVAGKQDNSGRIVADSVKLRDDDLHLASTVETRVDPIETRLTEVETKFVQSEKNAERLSGQIDEAASIAKAARNAAKAAQESGEAAAKDAARQGVEAAKMNARATNERITALDDYQVKSTTSVLFQFGSALLTKEAMAQLDTLAETAKKERGYMIEVTGHASPEGDAASNERLSQRRADAVVRYLAENHVIPLRRLATPFGFGSKQPVADSSTREGKKLNRRVEIRILVSKGLIGQAEN
jgi:OmpA-OmpF porin, OOP family